MAAYSIRILKSAVRELERLDKSVARRIVERIKWLSGNLPSAKHTALKGELSGLFKLREGDYRIIYQVLHREKTLLIHAIGHRKEIYR
jgi:mRNA interferase RelE/StbE